MAMKQRNKCWLCVLADVYARQLIAATETKGELCGRINKEKIQVSVLDVTGRFVEQIIDIKPKSSIKLGRKYQKGMYFVQISQGHEKLMLKLEKLM